MFNLVFEDATSLELVFPPLLWLWKSVDNSDYSVTLRTRWFKKSRSMPCGLDT